MIRRLNILVIGYNKYAISDTLNYLGKLGHITYGINPGMGTYPVFKRVKLDIAILLREKSVEELEKINKILLTRYPSIKILSHDGQNACLDARIDMVINDENAD